MLPLLSSTEGCHCALLHRGLSLCSPPERAVITVFVFNYGVDSAFVHMDRISTWTSAWVDLIQRPLHRPNSTQSQHRVCGHSGVLNNVEYTVHISEYRGNSTQYTVQNTQYGVCSPQHRLRSTQYRVRSTQYRARCIQYRGPSCHRVKVWLKACHGPSAQ